MAKQHTFAGISEEFGDYWKESGRKVHGGENAKGKRKTARPLNPSKPVHLVLRSRRAQGIHSLRNNRTGVLVNGLVYRYAQRWGIKIYEYSNNFNHLHIVLKAPSRKAFQKYLRTISGVIARVVLGAKRGEAQGKFWDGLAFTRITEWGRDLKHVALYVMQNILEAAGVVPYKPRKHGPRVKPAPA
jgi:putative transposase